MEHPLIDLVNISKTFDDTMVLDDLNLAVKENTFVTLLGPSGCGKTTTLRIIGGSTVISSIVDSRPISTLPPSITISIFPPRSSRTCSAVVGLGRPEVFALGAETNPPAALISSAASSSV